jgi:hypothetical protein
VKHLSHLLVICSGRSGVREQDFKVSQLELVVRDMDYLVFRYENWSLGHRLLGFEGWSLGSSGVRGEGIWG